MNQHKNTTTSTQPTPSVLFPCVWRFVKSYAFKMCGSHSSFITVLLKKDKCQTMMRLGRHEKSVLGNRMLGRSDRRKNLQIHGTPITDPAALNMTTTVPWNTKENLDVPQQQPGTSHLSHVARHMPWLPEQRLGRCRRCCPDQELGTGHPAERPAKTDYRWQRRPCPAMEPIQRWNQSVC